MKEVSYIKCLVPPTQAQLGFCSMHDAIDTLTSTSDPQEKVAAWSYLERYGWAKAILSGYLAFIQHYPGEGEASEAALSESRKVEVLRAQQEHGRRLAIRQSVNGH